MLSNSHIHSSTHTHTSTSWLCFSVYGESSSTTYPVISITSSMWDTCRQTHTGMMSLHPPHTLSHLSHPLCVVPVNRPTQVWRVFTHRIPCHLYHMCCTCKQSQTGMASLIPPHTLSSLSHTCKQTHTGMMSLHPPHTLSSLSHVLYL